MFLNIIHRLVFCLKCRPVYISKHVSETGFYLCPQVIPTLLGPIDRANPHLRTGRHFRQKMRQWKMSKNIKIVRIYHHHKPLDHIY
jgi:hypothetical protein